MAKFIKRLIICMLVIILFISSAIFVINLPKFARVKRAFNVFAQDGHFFKNASAFGYKKGEFMIQRRNERDNINKGANAREYLNIKTYDLSNQPVHPDVVYIANGFQGYKYWMAYTPYPFSNALLENPCIAASNDGVNWDMPYGGNNPIVPPPDDVNEGGHYSDTDMMFINGKLRVYYVYNKQGALSLGKIYMSESSDGIKWSSPELVYQTKKSIEIYSPAIIYKDNLYRMWCFAGENRFFYTTSHDGKTWDDIKKINIVIDGWRTWHLDVSETDLGYEALICSRKEGTNTRALFYASSSNGVDWNVNKAPVIYPTIVSWDSGGIYRSTFSKQNGKYKVWYSAYDQSNKWHIGYAEGENIGRLKGMK